MKTLFLALLLSGAAHSNDAVNTLQASGWFNSHHKAYQFGPSRPIYDAQAQQMQVYRELANEQIRASGGFHREIQQRTCYQTQFGTQCN